MRSEESGQIAERIDRYDVIIVAVPILVFGVAWLLGWWKNDAIAVALTFGMMLMINVRLAMLSRAWTRYSRPLLVGVALGLAAVQAAALVAVR